MAEKQGFEPWVALLPQLISSQSRSATPASLHGADFDSSLDGIATKYDIYQIAKYDIWEQAHNATVLTTLNSHDLPSHVPGTFFHSQ